MLIIIWTIEILKGDQLWPNWRFLILYCMHSLKIFIKHQMKLRDHVAGMQVPDSTICIIVRTYLYALIQSNQKNQHREDITTTTFLLPKLKIMFPTGQCLLGAASKDQMVRCDQEKKSFLQNEVLHTEKTVKQIPLRVADKLNSNNSIQPYLRCCELHLLSNSHSNNENTLPSSNFFVPEKWENKAANVNIISSYPTPTWNQIWLQL